MRKLLGAVSIAASLLAADSAVEGPTLGFVNSAAGVRSVLGVVGAARLSAPVTGELQGAVVVPGSATAIAKNPVGALVRVNFQDASVTSLGIEDVIDFAVSPNGTATAARSQDRLHILFGLDDARKQFSFTGAARRMAVSDSGRAIALSTTETDGEALYVVDEEGARNVFRTASISAVAFLPESDDAVFADSKGNVYRVSRDRQLSQIGSIEGVTALAGASNGRVIAVAGRAIAALPLDGSPSTTVNCSCDASGVQPFGQSRFLLSSGSKGPLWVLDASTAELRLAFIPEAVNE